jgi:hypothetical protein
VAAACLVFLQLSKDNTVLIASIAAATNIRLDSLHSVEISGLFLDILSLYMKCKVKHFFTNTSNAACRNSGGKFNVKKILS